MKKRILSIALALAVMLVSLPMVSLGINVSAEEAENIVITNPDTPILEVDKVIANFDGLANDSTTTYGEAEIGIGIGSNTDTPSAGDYAANSYNSYSSLTIKDDELEVSVATSNSNGSGAVIWLSPVSPTKGSTFPSSNTIALQFRVDMTGVTSLTEGTAVPFEPKLYFSTGRSSGAWGYCLPDKKYIYIPDATEENPNPEAQILSTGGGVQVYHGVVYGYAGQSGTIIVPLDAYDTTYINQFSGNVTIWNLYTKTENYRHRSYIYLHCTKQLPVGDYYTVDEFQWMKKAGAKEGYDNTIVAVDFNDAAAVTLGGWGNGPAWAKGTNFFIENGKLVLKKTCEGEGRATTTVQIPSWSEEYDAYAFDFDASQFVTDELLGTDKNNYIRMGYAVNATATTAYASSYLNGAAKFIWEDGTVTDTSVGSNGTKIPHGFKGQIVVPAESVQLSDAVKEALAAGGQSVLNIEIMGTYANQKDVSIYVDNFVYYYNNPELGEGMGVNFSTMEDPFWETTTPITEDIKTIELYFKTDAKTNQGLLGTKYGAISYHENMVELTLTATGQLDAKIGSAKLQVTNYALNDGKWHHVAITADEANSRIVAYVDGKPAAMKEIGTVTFGRSTDYFQTTIGNFLPAESEATKIQEVFEGEIANVRFWSDARTTEEIVANAQASVGADAEGLIAEWMLTGEDFHKDTTGKYDLKSYYWNIGTDNELYAQYLRTSEDGEFTIVFVPDTQTVMKNYKGQENSLFDWIIANKETLNIKAVVSLGDITEYTNSASKRNEEEWQLMSAQWNRLTEAQIPWVPTIGDHDYEDLYTDTCDFYNQYFTEEMLYQDENFQLGGLYDENSLVNGYYLLEVTETTKFLIMNLEVLPRDEVLEWANQVIADHPDYGVIVATHRNMTRVYCERYTEVSYNHGNAGEDVWQKMVSQHENMVAYMSGHTETMGYYANHDTGVNGNKVLQMVSDMQNHDQFYKTLQVVTTMRFSADASTAIIGSVGTRPNVLLDSDAWQKTWELNTVTATVETKHEVVFKDILGNTLKTLEVTEGDVIDQADVPAAPARYGYTFTDWSEDVTAPIMTDMVITALYEKDGDMQYEVTAPQDVQITLPNDQTDCYYNDRVTLVAPAEKDGKSFSYWKFNGGIFSYSNVISFLAFGDVEVEAVYGAEVGDKVVVFTDTNPTITDHKNGKYDMHVMGVVYAPQGEVTEIGIILGAGDYTAEEMIDGTAITVKMKASKATAGRQFVYTVKNIPYDQYRTAITYAVIDGVTYYSEVSCVAVVEAEGDNYGGDNIVEEEGTDPFE